jgi:hypothetical protein
MGSSQTEGMGRREFIGAAAAALFAGVVITMTGCDKDDATGPGDGGKAGLVEKTNGHNHDVKITKAQIDAGGAVTLTLTGNGHTHDLKLTAEEVANIKSGAGVHNKPSEDSGTGHTHLVHFM